MSFDCCDKTDCPGSCESCGFSLCPEALDVDRCDGHSFIPVPSVERGCRIYDNNDRARGAMEALHAYERVTGSERDTSLSDLLADLRHLADQRALSWDEILERADQHYAAEIRGQ